MTLLDLAAAVDQCAQQEKSKTELSCHSGLEGQEERAELAWSHAAGLGGKELLWCYLASVSHESEQQQNCAAATGTSPSPRDWGLAQRESGSCDIGPGGRRCLGLGSQYLAVALSAEQLWYLRSQGLHENECFSDVACLFLPGAAVILFLATHLLQSGSRGRCEEEEKER